MGEGRPGDKSNMSLSCPSVRGRGCLWLESRAARRHPGVDVRRAPADGAAESERRRQFAAAPQSPQRTQGNLQPLGQGFGRQEQ